MQLRLIAIAGLIVLASCPSPTKSSPPKPVAASLTMSDSGADVQAAALADTSRQQVTLTLNLGPSPKRVYFVLTNESTAKATSGMPSISGQVASPQRSVVSRPLPSAMKLHPNLGTPPEIIKANREVLAMRQNARSRSLTGPSLDSAATTTTIGDSKSFYLYGVSGAVPCTLEAMVDRSGSAPNRKLFVWVADNCRTITGDAVSAGTYIYNGPKGSQSVSAWKPFTVTKKQAEALAEKFLASSGNDDIYSYVTDVFGKEYGDAPGSSPGSGYITPRGEIHIVIADINPSSAYKGQGGVLGYFYGANNYITNVYAKSNQKIMFVLDAQSLGNPTTDGGVSGLAQSSSGSSSPTWSLSSSYWPNEILSTLAHEFQHMIHFYQKQILNDLNTDTEVWINEMSSMVAEDLVGSHLNTLGPRGVQFNDTGETFAYSSQPGSLVEFNGSGTAITSATYNSTSSRISFFNDYYPYVPLESWADDSSDNLSNYGVAFSFGAWLSRNFGGAQLFHDIVTSPATDESAVVNAVNSYLATASPGTTYTMTQLVEKWAATMVMGSSATTAPHSLALQTTGSSNQYTLGTIDPNTYYPLHYDASNPNNSGLEYAGETPEGGPLVFQNFSGARSIPPRAFYYYAPTQSALSGTHQYVVTIPSNVHFDVVTVPN